MTDRLVGELSKHVCSYCDIGYHGPYCSADYKNPSEAQGTTLQTDGRRVNVTFCGPAEGKVLSSGIFKSESDQISAIRGQRQCSAYESQFQREQRYLELFDE
jgi:hypothetical protein